MNTLTCTQKFILKILRQGKIPDHIGFIMDGNRRHALKKGELAFKGHEQGAQSLKRCILFCLQLGIQQCSFYCFSLQNFNRKEQEITTLMNLAIKYFQEGSQLSKILEEYNVRVRVVGDIDRLRKDVTQALREVEMKTQKGNSMLINLCFAYDSMYEVGVAIKNITNRKMDAKQLIQVNPKLEQKSMRESEDDRIPLVEIERQLMISEPVDLLVRTSGENRLSNFMLVQLKYAYIAILKENWPEMSVLSFIKILLSYNYHYKAISSMKQTVNCKKTS